MQRYCYICGYKTMDENIVVCPQCLCDDVFVQSKEEEELMRLFDDRELTNAMLELKKNNLIEYKLKLKQFKIVKQQQEQMEKNGTDNTPHCPTCNSTNIKPIPEKVRRRSAWTLGLAVDLVGKTFECQNCGYMW